MHVSQIKEPILWLSEIQLNKMTITSKSHKILILKTPMTFLIPWP